MCRKNTQKQQPQYKQHYALNYFYRLYKKLIPKKNFAFGIRQTYIAKVNDVS